MWPLIPKEGVAEESRILWGHSGKSDALGEGYSGKSDAPGEGYSGKSDELGEGYS